MIRLPNRRGLSPVNGAVREGSDAVNHTGQSAPLSGVSKSAADRIIDHLGPALALQPRKRFRKDTAPITDGTLAPTRDCTVAERSKNYRCSTNHQVVIDADTRMVVAVGRPVTGNRNDCTAGELSGAKDSVGNTKVITDGGGLVIPHRREKGRAELPAWKEEHNTSHRKARARVEHVFARMKTWKIPRDCRLKGDGVHTAMLGTVRLHNLALARQFPPPTRPGRSRGGGSPPRRLGGCSVETELVALDVLHHDARIVAVIQESHAYRAERDQSCAFGLERGQALFPHESGTDSHVKVQPILGDLAFGDALRVRSRAHT